MKNKKILIVIVCLMLCVTCVGMIGCNKELDVNQAISDLKQAIDVSLAQDNYYTVFNDKTSPNTYKLNVNAANDPDNMTMQFSVEKDTNITVTYTHLYYRNGVLLYNNPEFEKQKKKDEKAGKPKERKNYDYFSKALTKEQLFTKGGFTIKEIIDGVVSDVTYDLGNYTNDAFFNMISPLTVDNTQVLSYKKNNVVREINLKINDETNFLSKFNEKGGIVIRMINDKVYYVADKQKTFVFDIVYVGPKIVMPKEKTIIAE